MRELARSRGEEPRPLKAMVPVNVRADEEARSLGNRISFAFVGLPLEVSSGRARLARIRHATAARAVASPRLFNLTISNVPGPDFTLYMLGAELLEAHPVVPLA